MKRIALCILFVSLEVAALASEWRPTPGFLKAVRFIESSNGANTIGDNGDSLGEFQLSEAAWLDVNAWRRARGLKIYPYEEAVFHAYINRVYASNYMAILHSELTRKLKRPPTHGELYAAYNLGLSTFAQCDYKIQRVNPITRARCEQIETLLAEKGSL